jgi:hypothetical protein
MRTSDVALGAVPFGLYLLNTVLSLFRPGSYLPPAWVYLLTAPPLVAYVTYRLLSGRTYQLWEGVMLAVVALSVLTLILPWASTVAGMPPSVEPPLGYYLLTGAPILGVGVVVLTVRGVRWQRSSPTNRP